MKTLEPVLAEHPFFKSLQKDYLALIVGCASNVRFEEGEYLFRSGEEANQFFLLRHGKLAMQVHAGHLGPITIQTLHEGEVVGWSWLIPPHRWSFDGRALGLVRAVALDGRCLREKCEDNHDLGYELLKRFSAVMVERLEATRQRLIDVYGMRS